MKKRCVAMLLTAAVLLAGCGSSGSEAADSADTTATAQEETSEQTDAAGAAEEADGSEAAGAEEADGSEAANAEEADGSEETTDDSAISDSEDLTYADYADDEPYITTDDSGDMPVSVGELFAMDTYMKITCYGEHAEEAVTAAAQEIRRLDALLSVGNPDSEVNAINEHGSGSVSEETMTMLKQALEAYETTGGAFDITIYPLMVEWGFTSGDFRVPDQTSIDALLKLVDSSELVLDEEKATLTLGEGQGIDLGGIAKGFTSDRLMELFEEYDVVAAVISLGGNVQCYRTKPDGSLWRCGIIDPNYPDDESNLMCVVELDGQAAITSGAYERNFTDPDTGVLYHHILDPSTGYSANSGLTSVTVISEKGILADTLSTALYVMGLDAALEYWQEYGDDFDLVLMTEDDRVYVTGGMKDRITSDYPIVVVE